MIDDNKNGGAHQLIKLASPLPKHHHQVGTLTKTAAPGDGGWVGKRGCLKIRFKLIKFVADRNEIQIVFLNVSPDGTDWGKATAVIRRV